MLGGVRDLIDGSVEGFGIGVGGLRRPGDLAHILQRCGMDFVGGRGGFEVMEGSNVSAHAKTVRLGADTEQSPDIDLRIRSID